jgi:hypothetical protein
MVKIKITDFKKYSKDETSKFLYDFINQHDWGNDRNAFATLLDKYFEVHKQFGDNRSSNLQIVESTYWIYIGK